MKTKEAIFYNSYNCYSVIVHISQTLVKEYIYTIIYVKCK